MSAAPGARSRGAGRLARVAAGLLAALALPGCGYLLPTAALAFIGSKGGGGAVVVLTAEGADLVLSRGPQDAGDTTEGRGATVVAAQVRLTATKATTLRRLALRAVGSGDDAAIPTVRLAVDLDGDAVAGPSDPALGVTTRFSADDGLAVFEGLAHAIPAGASVDLLVLLTTPAGALEQDTFAVEVTTVDFVDAVTSVDGVDRPVGVFGLPLRGGVKTISRVGSLRALLGPNSPPATSAAPNAQDVELLQLELRASSAEAVRITQLRLRTSGSGHDVTDVAAADLWLDADSDGRLDPLVDQAIVLGAAAQGDDGLLVFDGLAQTLSPSAIVRWLVVYDLSGAAADAATLRVDLAQGADLVAQGVTSGSAISVAGAPVSGGATLAVQRASLTVDPGPVNPARTRTPGATDVPVLQLRLRAGPAEAVTVATLGLRDQAGGGDEATDLGGVSLWHDVDADGVLDPGEPRLAGPSTYAADGGLLVFAPARQLAAGATEHWLVTYDLAPGAQGGDTFQCAAAGAGDLSASGVTSGLAVTSVVSTTPGGALSVIGSAALSVGPASPGATSRFSNAADVPALQVRVAAGAGEAVRLTSVVVQASGSAHDAQAVTSVELHRDADGDGLVGAGDTLLAAGTFLADDAGLTLSAPGGLVTAPAGSAVDLLVRYVLSGQGRQAETLRVGIDPAAIAAVGVGSGLPIAVSGAATTSAAVTLRRARLTFAPGQANPTDGPALAGQAAAAALQLDVTAGPGEDVDLTAITFSSSGTANEPGVVLRAWLYREGAGPRGVVDPTDGAAIGGPVLFAADDGQVTFDLSGAPPRLDAGTTSQLLLVYDLAAAAPAGGTLQARLAAAGDVTARGAQSTPPLTAEVLGAPVSGGTLTTTAAVATDPAAQVAGVPLADATVYGNETRREALALEVRETTGNDGMTLTSLAVTSVGAGDETTDVLSVRLFRDLGVQGTYEAGVDVPIGLTAFFAEPGTAVFAGLNEAVPAGGATSFLVTYDMADGTQVTDGETYRLTVAAGGVTLRRQADAGPVTVVSGLPVSGPVLTGESPRLTITRVAPPGADPLEVRRGAVAAITLRLRLTANPAQDITVSSLEVQADAGGGDEATEVAAAVVYRDVNGDGLLDAGDVELARRGMPFAADGGATTFSGLTEVVPRSGAALDLLVAYDLGPADATTDTFRATLQAATGVGVPAGVQRTLTPTPAAGRLLQVRGGVKAAPGPYTPGTDVMAGETAVLLLALTADPAEAVPVSALRLQASGGANDAVDLTNARLYLDDGDAVFEPGAGDALLAGPLVNPFATDDGAVTFTLAPPLSIPAGATRRVWCSLEPAVASGLTVRLSLTSDADLTVDGGLFVSGAPLTGPTFRVGASAGLFQPATPRTLLGGARAVRDLALADLDRDGDLDLIVLRSDGALETYAGDGAGGFAAGVGGPVLPAMTRFALGDVDGDGDLDVVAVGGADVVVVRSAAGTLTADPAVTIAGALLVDVVLVDLDGDRDLDVVVADQGNAHLRGLTNDGAGALTPGGVLATTTPHRLLVADVNRDGRPDLLWTTSAGDGTELKLALHDGASAFYPAISSGAVIGAGARHLAALDLDREGRLDLIVVDEAAQELNVAQGLGATLAFANQAPSDATLVGPDDPRELVVGDWDGDGRLDVAVAHLSGHVVAHRGDGSLVLPMNVTPPGVTSEAVALAGLTAPDLLVTGDLNRDGDPDLVVASTTDTGAQVLVLLGEGETRGGVVSPAAPTQLAWPGGGGPLGVAAGDFDRDGHPDYAVISSDGQRVAVYLNDDDASGFTQSFQVAVAQAGDRLRAIDLNGDGVLDLVGTIVGANGDGITTLLGDGDGTFQAPTLASCLGNADPRGLDLADFDGDGFVDAVVAEAGTSSVQLFRGTGAGFAGAAGPDRRSVGGGATPVAVAFVDADRDGHLDVLVLTRGPARLLLYRGVAGDLAGATAASDPLDGALGTPAAMALGDIDRDGVPDVIVTSADQDVMQALRGRGLVAGSSAFAARTPFASGRAVDVLLADLDKDGRLDIVAARQGPDGSEALLTHRLMDPTNFAFDGLVTRPTSGGGDPVRLATADFDRDGDLDVVAAIRNLDAVQVFLGE